eukprot:TRINITY_DN203_c0_g1_i1.p2 TRINITY_DN203_c0_g1~~TRINITY_DN203_c0_g1_i1.p2  ORF type:complete len:225 (+),score=111.91 TRINITY_DN203_c0_g1_i1:67-741(+)
MAKHGTRNPLLTRGVRRYSRSAINRKKAIYKFTKKVHPKQEKEKPKVIPAILHRTFSLDEAPKGYRFRKQVKPTKLKAGYTPGTVLIVLAGRFRARRVVFLKQLPSGLLLVTGPMKLNGVPLRRLNQAYTIATSQKVDVSGVDVSNIDDKFFAREKKVEKKQKGAEGFFEAQQTKNELPEAKKQVQASVDSKVLAAVKATPLMADYLKAAFSLAQRDLPHLLKF